MSAKKIDLEELYAKDENVKKEDVQIIQEWLKKQPHLPQIEENQILLFLHSCYYKIEFTKVTIDKYFTMRSLHPDIFNSLSEQTLRGTSQYVFTSILPKTTPEGYAVLLVKFLDPNPDLYNFTHCVSLMSMVLTLYGYQRGYEAGGVAVFDTAGFSFAHITKISLSPLKCALELVQEGAPVRIKGIHFINVVPALERFKMIIKPFLKSELFNMLEFHSSLETLHKRVPRECLPEDYGGKEPSCQVLHDENVKNLMDNYEFFHWHDSQVVDESKRIGERKGTVFGVDGTFKKIEVD